MKLSITQEHINTGKPRESCDCPIALALRPYFPDRLIVVHEGGISIFKDEYEYLQITSPPEQARQFIHDFDNGRPVVPFEFELNLIPEAVP